MKKFRVFIFYLFVTGIVHSQAYRDGEFLKYRIHYFFLNAGYATLSLHETQMNGQHVFHAVGLGKSSSLSSLVMSIDDRYETFFDDQNRPLRFIRHIREGNYHKNVEFLFHHDQNLLQVIDHLRNKVKTFRVPAGIQDMLSVYYKLRNVDTSNLKEGDFIAEDLFFDNEIYHFKMKILGRETIKTEFGKIKTIILRPYVQAERVFKEQESLTVWVTDDQNKIPVRIEAKLLVGSIKADLIAYRGLKYPIHFH